MDRINEFTAEWVSRSPHQMTSRMHDAYFHTLEWIKSWPHVAGFTEKGKKPDLDDGSEFSIAKHFYWYYDTHFFKAQNSLVSTYLVSHNLLSTNWLDQPKLWVLDIGCGTGAATCALLDLLCEYHDYRWKHGYPVWDTQLHIVAVDPCKPALDVYSKMLECLQPSLVQFHIAVEVCQVQDEFPQPTCLDKILKGWKGDDAHVLLAMSSNVIRPLQNMWDKLLGMLNLTGSSLNTELGDVIARAYEYLLDKRPFTQTIIIDIATNQKTGRGEWFFNMLKKIAQSFRKLFDQKTTDMWWNFQANLSVDFFNSPNTYHADHTSETVGRSDYYHSIQIGEKQPNIEAKHWHGIRDPKNLQLAWARARNYAFYNDLVDEVEHKLADYFWADYADRLANSMEIGDCRPLQIHHNIYYTFPKNREEDRPRYFLHLGEQLISAAVSQQYPQSFEPYDADHISGDRLNKERTEFFYERWRKHFTNYKKAIHNAARSNLKVLKVDVRSYYTRIKQNTLYDLLRSSFESDKSSIVAVLLRQVILRNLKSPPHQPNLGLPQSGITAGLWASKYLIPVDRVMLEAVEKSEYYRYADDITIVGEPDALDRYLQTLKDALADSKLGLELNPEKERRFDADKYKELNADDPTYKKISGAIQELLGGIYFLPREYRSAWKTDRDRFLQFYSDLLRGLGIYLPPYWLNRQIKTRSTLDHRIAHYLKGLLGMRVRFPPLLLSQDKWVSQFLDMNTDWVNCRDQTIIELVNFFHVSYEKYISPRSDDITKHKARGAVRFAVYRLSGLGANPIANDLEEILAEMPELLITSITLKALMNAGCVETVLGLGKRWQECELPEGIDGMVMGCGKFLCAMASWALGYSEPNEAILAFLYKVLFSPESDIIEKLMASEALIRLNVPTDEHLEEIQLLMQNNQSSPYLIKNLILLVALAHQPFQELVPTLQFDSTEPIIRDALQFAMVDGRNILSLPEPRELERYYAKWYPDLPSDLHRKHSSSS